MALTNYTDLQTSVINFLHRADLATIVPDLITLGEIRINGDLDSRLQDTKTSLSTTLNTEIVALPTDTINIRSLVCSASPNRVLEYLSPDAYMQAYPWGNYDIPEVYTVVGSNLLLSPYPDAVYSLVTIYKARVPTITSGTNYLMTNFPNVYLYATLCESAPYLKDDARIQIWETKYTEAIRTVNMQDWYSGSTMRVRQDVRA